MQVMMFLDQQINIVYKNVNKMTKNKCLYISNHVFIYI